MNNIDLKIVDNFLNECHKKIKNNPNLYINSKNDTVTIGLPTELLEFANRAAGHSGLNNGKLFKLSKKYDKLISLKKMQMMDIIMT